MDATPPNESVEWEIPDPITPVSQGDLLLSRNPSSGAIGMVCVVITADCDITHGKFGRQLACLRIITLHDYLSIHWAERKLRRGVDVEIEKFRERINKWHHAADAQAQPISRSAIVSWIQDCEPEEICHDLKVPAPEQKKAVVTMKKFREVLAAINRTKGAIPFDSLVAFRVASSGKSDSVCREEVIKHAQSDSLPDDVFLLPTLPQLERGPAVVLLREIFGVQFQLLCFRAAEAISADHFLRIGTLRPTFKYAISQAFGNLYARIGLPEAYEHRCKLAIEQFGNRTEERL